MQQQGAVLQAETCRVMQGAVAGCCCRVLLQGCAAGRDSELRRVPLQASSGRSPGLLAIISNWRSPL